MHRWVGWVNLALVVACGEPDPSPLPPVGQAGSGGAGILDDGDDSEGTPVAECNPFVDPLQTCGPGFRCDVASGTCVPASGTDGVDADCSVIDPNLASDTCLPALVCAFTGSSFPRCQRPCDPVNPACEPLHSCIRATDIPDPDLQGVCVPTCANFDAQCPRGPSDACFPVTDGIGQPVAACLPAGFGIGGQPCRFGNDCAPGLACVPGEFLAVGCPSGADCCSPLCSITANNCLGADTDCIPFGFVDQPDAGFCGLLR